MQRSVAMLPQWSFFGDDNAPWWTPAAVFRQVYLHSTEDPRGSAPRHLSEPQDGDG